MKITKFYCDRCGEEADKWGVFNYSPNFSPSLANDFEFPDGDDDFRWRLFSWATGDNLKPLEICKSCMCELILWTMDFMNPEVTHALIDERRKGGAQ